jgi:hypothetical protein
VQAKPRNPVSAGISILPFMANVGIDEGRHASLRSAQDMAFRSRRLKPAC